MDPESSNSLSKTDDPVDLVIPNEKRQEPGLFGSGLNNDDDFSRKTRRFEDTEIDVAHSVNEPSIDEQKLQQQDVTSDHIDQCLKFFRKLVGDLLRHKYATPFAHPVDPIVLNVPDYFTIIDRPMDLGTIKTRLDTNFYKNDIDAIILDLWQVFDNCFHYNPPSNDVSVMGDYMHKTAIKKLDASKLFTREQVAFLSNTYQHKYFKDDGNSTAGLPGAATRHQRTTPLKDKTSSSHIPKIKPNLDQLLIPFDGDTIPLSDSEKEKLFSQINTLPYRFLLKVIEFIEHTSPQTAHDTGAGVIEFEIDDLDVRVQRHLAQYVEKCIHVLSNVTP
ncbi:putative transcription factor GTE12 [Blattamonas nauphoetae]|uniref:Transcription factor GTE12 n=1 Tax=Blattamonas nauphoetae TaxID=2049346 RepID=A0ABQ9Y027_9EUKA|nr:putative transcription factor GTE12 [Blattamonas nauphoetae]